MLTLDQHQKNRLARRYKVLKHYSDGDEPRCACCGEHRLEFLCIDHIDGGGNEHRRRIGKSTRMFEWLSKNGLPEGFRVLCHNCNLSIGFYGYTPHEAGELQKQVVDDYLANRPGRGARHHAAKLSDDQMRVVKKRVLAGERYAVLTAEYGLSKGTLNHIKKGRQWKHV